jgi:hypothetical protein
MTHSVVTEAEPPQRVLVQIRHSHGGSRGEMEEIGERFMMIGVTVPGLKMEVELATSGEMSGRSLRIRRQGGDDTTVVEEVAKVIR